MCFNKNFNWNLKPPCIKTHFQAANIWAQKQHKAVKCFIPTQRYKKVGQTRSLIEDSQDCQSDQQDQVKQATTHADTLADSLLLAVP